MGDGDRETYGIDCPLLGGKRASEILGHKPPERASCFRTETGNKTLHAFAVVEGVPVAPRALLAIVADLPRSFEWFVAIIEAKVEEALGQGRIPGKRSWVAPPQGGIVGLASCGHSHRCGLVVVLGL